MSHNPTKLLKQRLQRVHVAAGITFSLFMYVAVFFGIFAIFYHTFKHGKNHQDILKQLILKI